MLQWLRPLLLLVICALTSPLAAQLNAVNVFGTVKDVSTARKLDGVTISVYKDGTKVVDVQTNAHGKYEVNLDYGAEYKIECSKPGLIGKNITIDTREVPEEERLVGHGMNIDFTMMTEISGVDYSILEQPFGKAKYDPVTGTFEWDMEYIARMRDAVARLLKEYQDRQKREANAEAEFAKAMEQGDKSMNSNDFKKAVDHFTTALEIKPGHDVATARLSDARMRLEGQDAEKKLNEQYAALIKEGDQLFSKSDFESAKNKFTEALTLKEEEAYPKQKIKEIDLKLEELAKKAEEERLAKELQEKFDNAIAAGDAAFGSDDLDQAETKYKEAAQLKPQEKLPKDKLAQVATRRKELADKAEQERLAQEEQQQYEAAIAAGDAAFNSSSWDQAIARYNEASTIKPEEQYPKDQLAAIEAKKAEEADKAEQERLAAELQAKYDAAIAAADAAFNGDQLDEAEAKYNEAIDLKPEENYPKDQLAAIEKKRADLLAQEEAKQKARELEEQYNALIADADAAFNKQKWDDARSNYSAASDLRPEESYPKDRLAEIDRQVQSAELQANYDAAIAAADDAFDQEDWTSATSKYQEALGLKPEEVYPKERLSTIEQRIAEAEELRKQEELETQYQSAIAAADAAFDADELSAASDSYEEALRLKPEETYPQQRLDEIAARMSEQEKLAEEERKRQELEAKYNDLIAKADAAFDQEELSAALNDYKSALDLRPEEEHPQTRIAEIEQKLDAAAQAEAEEERLLREQQERDQRYADLITAADAAFNANEFDQAATDYNAALEVKPEESYPQEQLAEIDRLKAELAAQDEAARLAEQEAEAERLRLEEEERRRREMEADAETRYNTHIAMADQAYTAGDLDLARSEYTAALGVKPEEQYPQDRIAEIDAELARIAAEEEARRLAELQADEEARLAAERDSLERAEAEARRLAEEEDRRRREGEREVQRQYDEAIAAADLALAEKRYEEARSSYAQASDIKPEETYPLTKIDQIDKLLEEMERQRIEAELAAQKAEQERLEKEQNNTTIDIRKEQEAEQFMREARAQEEAEKYARIQKFRSELEEEERANAEQAYERVQYNMDVHDQLMQNSIGLYEGDDERRRRNIAELEQMKEELADAHARREDRSADLRRQNERHNEELIEAKADLDRTWSERHAEQIEEMARTIEQVRDDEQYRTQKGRERSFDAREQAVALAENEANMRSRGEALVNERYEQLQKEKRSYEVREQQLVNISEENRQRTKDQLDNIPRDQPRDFSDYNRNKLAMEYPPGVTEESYTEGNKVIIRRVVVNGNKADEYSKVIAKWGTFYFKNGQSITEAIWSAETEG